MPKPRKKRTPPPTPRQIRAATLVIGNLKAKKPKTIGAILIEAGYTEQVAKKAPSNVTKSQGFIKAIEKAGGTDKKLTKVLMEGLDATKIYGKDSDVEHPDYAVRHKYLDTALKLKGYTEAETDKANAGNTYNTFIQQNNLDPNTPESRQLVDNTLDMLMAQTKRPAKE
jgi:hypothetical protein